MKQPRVTASPLETLSATWRGALDAVDRAIRAGAGQLPAGELAELARRLRDERASTARALDSVARPRGNSDPFVRLMVPRSQLTSLLGLPPDIAGCVFDLDGLLIGGAAAHASAWAETFNELIEAWPIRSGESIALFDSGADYASYLHGKPRLEGIRAFLASRGIRLPEGSAEDEPGAESVFGLANRKQQALVRYLDEHGVAAFAGARRYLELVREAGIPSAVISASVNTMMMLNRAGLASEVDFVLDGNAFAHGQIRPHPSPDSLLAVCEHLGIEPRRAAAFETTVAGVIAARRAGVELVVGVDRAARNELRAQGARVVVAEVGELLRPGGVSSAILS